MRISRNAQRVERSGVRAMFDRAAGIQNTINLCLGEPGAPTPKKVIDEAVKYLLAGKTKYTPNRGILSLRAAISEKLARENGVLAQPDKNILVTVGATQALALSVMLLAGPGDEVILPDPSWPNYRAQVLMSGAKPVFANLCEENGFCMTREIIEPLITPRTRLIMINSPANPTGGVIPRQELEKIADLTNEKKIPVISDEPYEKILFDGREHVSLASFPQCADYVITINSFSKTYAMTGFRVGYAAANEELINGMLKLHEPMVSCVCEAFQYACVEALHSQTEFLEQVLREYSDNRRSLVEGLNSLPGVRCQPPDGTFYAFANISGTNMSSCEMAQFLLDGAGVVCAPGSAFGEAGEGYLRFSFAAQKDRIEQAVHRMQKAIKP